MYSALTILYLTYLSHFPGFILRGPPQQGTAVHATAQQAVPFAEFVSRTEGPHRP